MLDKYSELVAVKNRKIAAHFVVKQLVRKCLGEYAEERARQLGVYAFLQLLLNFTAVGVTFNVM